MMVIVVKGHESILVEKIKRARRKNDEVIKIVEEMKKA